MCDAPRSPPTEKVPPAKAAQRFLCGGRGAGRAGLLPEAKRPTRGRSNERQQMRRLGLGTCEAARSGSEPALIRLLPDVPGDGPGRWREQPN